MNRLKSSKIITLALPLLCALIASNSSVVAQSADDEVNAYIIKLEKGDREGVKQELPKLAAKYQNNPGIIYLQGRLASDGIEAVKFYQSIVDNFPKSQWADDGLYRIYQYYYALGLYRTAEIKMQQLKKDYPTSIYVTGKPDIQFPKQDEVAVNLPTHDAEAIKTDTTTEIKSAAKPPVAESTEVTEPYTLQVGAFSTVSNAEKQKNYFEEQGYTVEITNKVRGGRSLYLVWAGNFKTADEARRVGKEVKAKYKIESIVVERY
jgi:cell division septation protein DedD